MIAFLLSLEAGQDLTEIHEFIAQDSLEAAERLRGFWRLCAAWPQCPARAM
jgi:hypothetical protein